MRIIIAVYLLLYSIATAHAAFGIFQLGHTAAVSTGFLLLTDGVSFLLLTDGVSKLALVQ